MKKKTSKNRKQSPLISEEMKESLSKKIHSFLKAPSYSPMSQSSLMKELQLTELEEIAANKLLTDMICEGIVETKKKKLLLAETKKSPVATGTLRMHPRGFGFVIPDAASYLTEDVFIPKHLTDNAVDGDIVEIAVLL
jgi:ribonuclease R